MTHNPIAGVTFSLPAPPRPVSPSSAIASHPASGNDPHTKPPLLHQSTATHPRQDPSRSFSYRKPHLGALLFDRRNSHTATKPSLVNISYIDFVKGAETSPLSFRSLQRSHGEKAQDRSPKGVEGGQEAVVVGSARQKSVVGGSRPSPPPPAAVEPAIDTAPLTSASCSPMAHIPPLPADLPRDLWPMWDKFTEGIKGKRLLGNVGQAVDRGQAVKSKRKTETNVHNALQEMLELLLLTAWETVAPGQGRPFAVDTLTEFETSPFVYKGKRKIKVEGGKRKRKNVEEERPRYADEVAERGDRDGDQPSESAAEQHMYGKVDVGVTFYPEGAEPVVRLVAEAKKAPSINNGTVGVSDDTLIKYDKQCRQRLNSAALNNVPRLWLISCIGYFIRPYFWRSELADDVVTRQMDKNGMYAGQIRPTNEQEVRGESRVGGGPSFDDWYDLRKVETNLLLQQMALDVVRDEVTFPNMYGVEGDGAWQHWYEASTSLSSDEPRPPVRRRRLRSPSGL